MNGAVHVNGEHPWALTRPDRSCERNLPWFLRTLGHVNTPKILRAIPPVVWSLVALAAVVGAVTFLQSAHGLVGFGTDRMRLPFVFALMNPVCVDVLSISAMVAAYVLRQAVVRVRLYVWLIFWLTLALSVAGNEAQAVARLLPVDGRLGAAAPPVLLAAAVHLAVVVARHYDRSAVARVVAVETAAVAVDVPEPAPATPEPEPADEPTPEPELVPEVEPLIEPTHRRTRTRPDGTPNRRRTRGNGPDERRHVAAHRVVVGGEGVNAVARDLHVSPAAVSGWAKQARAGSLAMEPAERTELHLVDAGGQA